MKANGKTRSWAMGRTIACGDQLTSQSLLIALVSNAVQYLSTWYFGAQSCSSM